jgi:MFS family permease
MGKSGENLPALLAIIRKNSVNLGKFRNSVIPSPASPRITPATIILCKPPPVKTLQTDVPARLDRLPWTSWHWLIVIALGITWILDGLEVTLAGSIGGVLKNPATLGLSDAQVGAGATGYLLGAVLGALGFGYATDLWGRKRLFFLTLFVYLAGTALTGLSWNFTSYIFFRFITGAGIGGEYAAINSAIDELIPARFRGRVDLAINSTFWIGAALGSGATLYLLDPRLVPVKLGWRLAFGIGASLGLVILFVRQWVPESPRWLLLHGRQDEANHIIGEIEKNITARGSTLPKIEDPPLRLHPRTRTKWKEIWKAMAHDHRRRSFLSLALMVAQAFFYNAIFFTYALVLIRFYRVPAESVGLYLLPFALGNVLGPFVLGPLFDTIGRKPMIALTYALSGILLALTAWLFREGWLTAQTQTMAWTGIFFLSSCAASSAYLTVSEIFPLEIRALAIAVFYAAGTLIGGTGAPLLFSYLIGTGSRDALFGGYLLGALLMIAAAGMELLLGVKAERQSLESIAAPLSSSS